MRSIASAIAASSKPSNVDVITRLPCGARNSARSRVIAGLGDEFLANQRTSLDAAKPSPRFRTLTRYGDYSSGVHPMERDGRIRGPRSRSQHLGDPLGGDGL